MGKLKHRDIRHDVEHDVVAQTIQKWAKSVYEGRNTIFVAIAALLVVWIVVKVAGHYRRQRIEQANAAIYVASQEHAGILDTDEEKRRSAVKAAEERLTQVARVSGDSPVGRRALYRLGVYQYQNLDFDKARETFEEFRKAANNDLDRARGSFAIGRCWDNQAFVEQDESLEQKALEAFRKAAEQGGDSYVKYLALMGQADILGRESETRDEAIGLLERVIEERKKLLAASKDQKVDADDGASRDDELDELEGMTLVDYAEQSLERLKAMM